jgi:hypothetical protein
MRWSRADAPLSWTSRAKTSVSASSVSCASKTSRCSSRCALLVAGPPARLSRERHRAVQERPRAAHVRRLRRAGDVFEPAQRPPGVRGGDSLALGHVRVGRREQARGGGHLGVVQQVMRALEREELRRDPVRRDARLVQAVLLQHEPDHAADDQRREHGGQPEEHPAVERA